MSTASMGFHPLEERLKTATRWLLWLGVGMIVVGAAAIVFPMVSTMALTIYVGALFFIFGVISLGVSLSIVGAGPFFASLLWALVSIGVGVYLLFNPQAGAAALTLTVGVLFMLQGAYETVFAFEMRPAKGWGAMLASAAASVVLAVVILGGWPSVSAYTLGILFGVNFLSSGVGLVLVSRAARP